MTKAEEELSVSNIEIAQYDIKSMIYLSVISRLW